MLGGLRMQKGFIVKLFREEEYGKIRTKSGDDAHFHKRCLWDIPFAELTEGLVVEFEIQPSHKGQLAFNIRPCLSNNLISHHGPKA